MMGLENRSADQLSSAIQPTPSTDPCGTPLATVLQADLINTCANYFYILT